MGDVAQERGQAMAQESKPTASSEQTCQKTSMLLNISKAPIVLLAKEKHQLIWENLSLLHSEEALTAFLDQHLFYSTKGFLQRPLMLEQPGQHIWLQPHKKLCQTQTGKAHASQASLVTYNDSLESTLKEDEARPIKADNAPALILCKSVRATSSQNKPHLSNYRENSKHGGKAELPLR